MRRVIGNSVLGCLGIGVAAGLGLLLASVASSQSPSGGGTGRHGGGHGGGDRQTSPSDYYHGAKPSGPAAFLTVHGGQYLVTRSSEFELVIMPLQMRIYGFDESLKPIDVKDIHVEMSLQLPTENRLSHIVFQYVAAAAGEQDYLVAAFDTKQLRDKETPMTLELVEPPRSQTAEGLVHAGFHSREDSPLRRPGFAHESRYAGRCPAARLPGKRRRAGQPRAGGEGVDRRISALSLRRRLPPGRPAGAAEVSAPAPRTVRGAVAADS